MEALRDMKKLAVVKLDYTSVDDKGLGPLLGLPHLRELSLDSTGVTDKAAPELKSISSLTALNLYHTLITEKGLGELKGALPSCAILFDRDSALPSRRSK